VDKRIVLILIILLGLGLFSIGGWFLFFAGDEKETKTIYEKAAASLLSSNAAEIAIKDSDEDGLRDWEEALWKTDPNNPDTDKDGYSDSEETRLGYNPVNALSNPNTGKKAEKTPILASPTSADPNQYKNSNLTQGFAKAISSPIKDPSQLEQTGLSNPFSLLDETTGQGLLQFINGFYVQIPEGEIKTRDDNSYESIQKYFGEIEKAIPNNLYVEENEEEILKNAMETSDFSKINEYIKHFEQTINNLKVIEAPSDFLEFHKREAELITSLKIVYENIKEINTDPLKTILALQEYPKIRKEMWELTQNFANIAQKYKVQ
jgi:hypothetical protein